MGELARIRDIRSSEKVSWKSAEITILACLTSIISQSKAESSVQF